MRVLLIIVTVLFLSTFVHAQQDKRLRGIEKDLNAVLQATKAPGFSVAIVEGDKIIYAKGFGYRDYENKIPADANTLYAVGSTTKAFTSALLGQLRHENELSFDDSPLKYIHEMKFYNDEMNNHIIIKDIISHRTGLPRHDFSWYLFPSHDKDSLMFRIVHHEPFTGVRKQWYYNNFMYLLQGVVAERITGKSWEENITERFFKPLEMNSSSVVIAGMKNSTDAAIGYELKKDSIISRMDYYDIAGMGAAGSINSSVNDMSKWLIAWINKGKFKDREILPEAYVAEAISSQAVVGGALPDGELPGIHFANYGYAWFLSSYKEHYMVQHGGNIDGFSANAAFFPSDSIGIVVLTNQDRSVVPAMVRNIIADRMLQTEKTDWIKRYLDEKSKSEETADAKPSIVENTKPSHILQDYTGSYSHPGYGKFNVAVQNDSLFAGFTLKKYYLKHVHYDVFEMFNTDTGSGLFRVNFSTADNGDISSAKIRLEGAIDHAVEFKRIPNVIDVDKTVLEQYTGSYELSGVELKIYIKEENKLYLFVPGQPEYELLAVDKHKFVFKNVEGFKVEFAESEDGSVNEVVIIQPNGTFKAVRK